LEITVFVVYKCGEYITCHTVHLFVRYDIAIAWVDYSIM